MSQSPPLFRPSDSLGKGWSNWADALIPFQGHTDGNRHHRKRTNRTIEIISSPTYKSEPGDYRRRRRECMCRPTGLETERNKRRTKFQKVRGETAPFCDPSHTPSVPYMGMHTLDTTEGWASRWVGLCFFLPFFLFSPPTRPLDGEHSSVPG